MANAIVNQLLNDPITQLKSYAATPQGHLYTEILQNLFNLDVEGERPKNKQYSLKLYDELLASAVNDSRM